MWSQNGDVAMVSGDNEGRNVDSYIQRVSAGQLCDLQTRPVHVASRTAIYGFSTISDDATALR